MTDATPRFETGTAIESFLLGERLGRGGMGEVWAARDLRLGRRVALKVVRRNRAHDAGAVARFLDEARLTARLSHPNIVTAYAAGEWAGQPWVALEFLDGDTLRARLRGGPLAVPEAVRVAHDVARAIEAAHAAAIVHGDLKPENVMLPSDGRLRVVDFGLARLFGDRAAEGPEIAPNAGTPAYLAPEQWRAAPTTPAVDVWALGVLLWELLVGTRPYERLEHSIPALRDAVASPDPAPTPPNSAVLPEDLVRLLAATLAKDPADRPSAAEVGQRLARRLGVAPLRADASPFRGLLAYGEEDAGWFFGRDREIAACVERLREAPVLPVLGASGAGKSSFVAAGVVPRLREQGPCVVLALRPGPHPLRALAAAVADATLSTWRTSPEPRADVGATMWQLSGMESGGDLPSEVDVEALRSAPPPELEGWIEEILANPGALGVRLRALAERGPRVVLVVDQLEEVFTQGASPADRDAFLAAVFGAADNPGDPVRVLCTLRDDFLGRLAEHLAVGLTPRQVFVLHAPDAGTLVRVLDEATQAAGARCDDPALYRALVAEVADSPAALPLVQFAARQLWDRRDLERNVVRRADWVAMGGAAGALSRHADEVLHGLTPDALAVARSLLLRLVTADGTRRTVILDEAVAATGSAAAVVVERLAAARLLAVNRVGADATLELAHDSLVSTWAQLARWLDDAREGVRFSQEIEEAARLWDRRGRVADGLWRGEALRDAELRARGVTLHEVARSWLLACRRAEDARVARRVRWRRGGVATAVVVAALSVAAALGYRSQAEAARTSAIEAIEAESRALAEGAWSAWARGEPHLARARLRAAAERAGPDEAWELWAELRNDPVVLGLPVPSGAFLVDLSADGTTIAVAGNDGMARVIDVASGRTRSVDPGLPAVEAVAVQADGRAALCVGGGQASWWDLERDTVTPAAGAPYDGAIIAVRRAGSQVVAIGLNPDESGALLVWSPGGGHRRIDLPAWHIRAAFSDDGAQAYTLSLRGEAIWRWDLRSGRGEHFADLPARLLGAELALSVDERRVSVLGTRLVTWDAATGDVVEERPGLGASPRVLVDGPDGIAAIASDGEVWSWDPGAGPRLRARLARVRGEVWREGFHGAVSGDRHRLALTNEVGVYVVDTRATAPGTYSGHEDYVSSLAVDPQGRAYSASADGRVYRWDAPGASPEGPYATHTEAITRVALSADGALLATASNDDTASLWWATRKAPSVARVGHADDITGTAIAGDTWWTADIDGAVRGWRLPTPYDAGLPTRERPLPLAGSFAVPDRVLDLAARPGAVAVALESGAVEVRDLAGRVRRRIEAHAAQAGSVAWLADGSLVSSGYDRKILHYDPDGTAEPWDEDAVETTLLAPVADGRLAWASMLGVRLGDGTDAPLLWRGAVSAVAAAPAGDRVWFGDAYGAVRAIDAATGAVLGQVAGWVDGEPLRASSANDGMDREIALAQRAIDGGDVLCLWRASGALSVWRRGDRTQVFATPGPTTDVVPDPQRGCWWREDNVVLRVTDGAAERAPGEWVGLVAAPGAVMRLGEHTLSLEVHGEAPAPTIAWDGAPSVALVVRGPAAWWLFTEEGRLFSLRDGAVSPGAPLAGLPSAPLVSAAAVDDRVALLGFSSGEYGTWDLVSGRRIVSRRLRGAATWTSVVGGRGSVGSDLGDRHDFDVAGPATDACGWRREILAQIPFTWADGQLVAAPAGDPRGCGPDAP